MAWEVGHVRSLLQIPDLDLGIGRSSAKNQTIRMELSTGESYRGVHKTNVTVCNREMTEESYSESKVEVVTAASALIGNFGENSSSLDIRKGPILHGGDKIKDMKESDLEIICIQG